MKKKQIKKLKNELEWWCGYKLGLDHAVACLSTDVSFKSRNNVCDKQINKIRKKLLKEKKCKTASVG